MTEQEEIREGVAERLYKMCAKWTGVWYPPWNEAREEIRNDWRNTATEYLQYLASEGGVLKVERELPGTLIDELEYGWATCTDFRWGVSAAQKDMLKAGYEAVEPLIGEE